MDYDSQHIFEYGNFAYSNLKIRNKLFTDKIILQLCTRQVRKPTIIRYLLAGEDFLFLNGDQPTGRILLDTPNTVQIRSLLGQGVFSKRG